MSRTLANGLFTAHLRVVDVSGFSSLLSAFAARYARRAGGVAQAPGRVNLIGEHTDYNGLPVFPMALQRCVRVAFVPRDDARVRLFNVDSARYEEREFELSSAIEPSVRGDWGNYAKAAGQELVSRFAITRGIDALVTGDVPPAAGLSSSSATVVALTLALLHANEIDVERTRLMELTARAERYVGVESGGMDQAISLGGRAGHAVMIEFDPLVLAPVPIPSDWSFVIANSLVGAEKSGRARDAYNTRVRECREALARVCEARPEWPKTWRGLVKDVDERELLNTAESMLEDKLFRRFRHVVTEGRRVSLARDAMLANDFDRFGELMNASHESLRDDYEVSCGELDDLVAITRDAGAAGARLTGAGFGGCIVALCENTRAARVVNAIRTRYLASHAAAAVDDSVFIAEPSDAATIAAVA